MIGMIGILNNPSTSLNSHSAGWNHILATKIGCEILNEKDDWNQYNTLIINHGLNFKPGSFNIIGGFNPEIYQRITKLLNFKGKLFQIDGFQMSDFVEKRNLSVWWDEEIPFYEIPKADKLIVGDSHSVSVWPGKKYEIARMDGKTLYGFLKDPFIRADYYYFGNIDIRFHLGRQSNPIRAAMELAKRYVKLAKQNNAKVSCLLPVESETRKLPGTGKYKGQNFFGTRELRARLVHVFNNVLINSELEVNRWPEKWYQDINFYEKEVMEPRQSVHLRPKYYQH